MSAPPIGIMTSTPRMKDTIVISQNTKWLSVSTKMKMSNTSEAASARFTRCRCGSRIGAPLMRPSSLRKAMTEPVKVMAPMARPSDISTRLALEIRPGNPRSNAAGA
jgi:hypothetical protein